MNTSRRNFFKTAAIIGIGIALPLKNISASFIEHAARLYNLSIQKIVEIIDALKSEGSNLVLKVMDGKKYIRDPYYHYPKSGGIVDEETGCRVFFHAHRENEYGHFHTFATDDDGELVHLILISMDKSGKPKGLATVNNWVTGDKYVKADRLKELLEGYKINHKTFKEKRLIEFIEFMLDAYKDTLHQLFEEKDKWVRDYAFKYTREPFEDRDYEVTSFRTIDVFEDYRRL